MTMNAVAIVKIAHQTLREALRPSGGEDLPDVVDRGDGLSFRMTPLDDATLIHPTLSFDHEPDEIADALKRCLGGVMSAHRDSRGVLVFPDKAMPQSKSYDGVIDEIGELGFWVSLTPKPKSAPRPQPAPEPARPAAPSPSASPFANMGGLAEQMQALMSAIPPEALAQIQQAMMSGDASQLANMEAQLQAALGHDQLASLQESLLGSLGGVPDEAPGEDQMAAMMAQAQEQMEALRTNNPALFESLQKQFGGGEEAGEASDEHEAPPAKK